VSRHSIDPEAIERHMRFLASDDLHGRATATQGYVDAAEYVAGEFEKIGLDPAGGESTYYQQVPLIAAHLLADASRLALRKNGTRIALEIEQDYILRPDFLRQSVETSAPLAHVGFGVRAPEFGHDDYAGIDARGKILVVIRGAPSRFPHDERAYYSSSRTKLRTAVDAGAVGVIFIESPAERANRPWERAVIHSRMPAMRWIGDGGRPYGAHEELLVVASLSTTGEERLFSGELHTRDEVFFAAEDGRTLSFDLSSTLEVLTITRHERLKSPNVIGRLPGSDPELAGEHVVLTAHLDHVGAVPVEAGDDGIHNGAYDNASGVAILIEAAAAMAGQDQRPRRSVLFVAVTGEEKGLLGSEYFVKHPTVDAAGIVADVNLDMVLMFHPLKNVVAFGAEHSSLGINVQRAVNEAGLRLVEDPIPDQVFFVRSDQYSFVREGVPSIFLISGFDAGDDGNGLKRFHEWTRTVYHSPADDMGQAFDFQAGADFAHLNVMIAADVANAAERPRWNPGDFFGRLFGAPDASD
jgi:hypothetical protein